MCCRKQPASKNFKLPPSTGRGACCKAMARWHRANLPFPSSSLKWKGYDLLDGLGAHSDHHESIETESTTTTLWE